ncbi:MAG: DNA primase [Acidimicrobiia bacterium]
MAFHRDDIERVRHATNIVELLEGVTTVRKRGRTFTAICPFHQEKTPSLSIDVAQGLYHCFGCQAGGDVFKFVQETQGLDFSEAVEQLAARAGIALQRDPEVIRRKGEREGLIEATRTVVDFYQDRLKTGQDAGGARSYLRGRGYDVDVIDRFRLGYAPGGDVWDALVTHLRAVGVSEKVMIDAGLAARTSRGRLRDWFRGRIMFPIFDLRGEPVGFGARILEGDGPKYLNSPETRIYQKARLLYGPNWAKPDITRAGFSLVVEGYTDVIGLHLAGMPQAVATCGTALGEDHFDLLRRFAERVVLAFDADQAGAGAAIRGDELEIPVKLDLDLRVAVMPEGKDPADLVQTGEIEAMRSAVEGSMPLLQFRLARELERFDLSEPEGRARAVRETAGLIARQHDDLVRREYARFIARRVGTDFEAVMAEIRGGTSARRSETRVLEPEPRRRSGVERAERELLRALLVNDARLAEAAVDAGIFMDGVFREAYVLLAPAITGLPPGEPPDLAALIGEGDSGAPALLRALALDALPISDPVALVDRLAGWRIERDIADLRRVLDQTNPAEEPQTYSAMFEQLIGLERKKRELGDR